MFATPHRAGKATRQLGLTLLEMLISLGILASVVAGVASLVESASDDARASVTALHTRTVGDAASVYIRDNYAAITTIATAATPALIRVSDLVSEGYLSTGYSAINPRGQATCVLVLQPSPGRLAGLVITEGGEVIDDLTLGQIAASIGGAGGGIYSTDPATARGAMGGYAFPVGAFANPNSLGQRCDGTAGSVSVQAGHLVMALWFADGAQGSATLYRDEVPGNPGLNTMNTPILMGATSVRVSGDACTTPGAIARDAAGAVLACASGTWRSAGSAFWQDAVPNFASLPVCNAGTVGQTRIALTPTVGMGPRAYTCATTGIWRALSINDQGDIFVPGTANLARLGGDLEIVSVAVAGAACGPDGRLARSADALLLTCQTGIWASATPSAGGSIPNMYVVSTSGLFVIPAERCRYTVVGGGGGGSNQVEGAAGGGGGAALGVLDGLLPGATITVTIGAGGGPTAFGGTTQISSGSQIIPTIQATGGRSGNGNWTGYAGGIGIGGQLNLNGGPGESYGRQVGYPVGGNSIFGGGAQSNENGRLWGGGGSRARSGAQGVVVFEC